jgi:23S rRNA (guanosine2251-2'-O)-methyltransferase
MPAGERPGEVCPWCGAPTTLIATTPVGADDRPHVVALPPLPLAVLVDNVRSTFNVGSIFRSADGAGWGHLYLCGITPTPTNPKLAKTALGAQNVLPWTQHNNALALATALKAAGNALWALEETATATSLFATPRLAHPLSAQPLVLVVGNEVVGVDPAILALCDKIVAIPMRGVKRSLNVATAFGVAAVVLAQRLG